MRAVVVALLLAACGSAPAAGGTTLPPPGTKCPPSRVAGPGLPELDAPSGTWVDDETRAYLVVAMAGGAILTLFTIDDDGEVWPVSDAAWDGTTLTFTTYVPSTGYTIRRTLTLGPDGESLVGSHDGSHTGTGDVWKRYHPPAP